VLKMRDQRVFGPRVLGDRRREGGLGELLPHRGSSQF
jgi:hypothetical protein